jgi:hypothetical protein
MVGTARFVTYTVTGRFRYPAAERAARHRPLEDENKKPSRSAGRVPTYRFPISLSPHNVCRLEAFGAFQQIKLYGFAFVQ